MTDKDGKLVWAGQVISVQPRIRLTRSFDQSSHSYLGYALRVQGTIGGREGTFTVGIGVAAEAKHAFRASDEVQGAAHPVASPDTEAVEYYKVSGLRLKQRAVDTEPTSPPGHGTPPELPTYRARGHRRLDPRTYEAKCQSCIWGCRMPVEIIIDQWKPNITRWRFETFCYGPKSCRFYAAGPTRKVPGRKGMSWEEEDWVDAEATAHRGDDE
jgi:hypothetical protein